MKKISTAFFIAFLVFLPVSVHAGVLDIVQNTQARPASLATSNAFTQSISITPNLTWRLWGGGSTPSTQYLHSVMAVIPRMTATSTANITIEYGVTKTGSNECYLAVFDAELTSSVPTTYKITSVPKSALQVTATTSVSRATITGSYSAGGSLGTAGYQQFALGSWLQAGYNGLCSFTVYSVRSGGLELLATPPPIAYTPPTASGGSGGVITFPEEPLYTLDVGTTLAVSVLAGILSIITVLYISRK